MMKLAGSVFGFGLLVWLLFAALIVPPKMRCDFDRNEIGPKGAHGQWYWDIFKCSDGTERRVLVAGERG